MAMTASAGARSTRADERPRGGPQAVDGVAEHRAARGAQQRAPDRGRRAAGRSGFACVGPGLEATRARSQRAPVVASARARRRARRLTGTRQRAARGHGSQHQAGRPRRRGGSRGRGRRRRRRGGQARPRSPARAAARPSAPAPTACAAARTPATACAASPAGSSTSPASGSTPAPAARGDLDGAVHDTRKAFKRLRALVRVSRDALGDEAYRRENTIFRDAGRKLSGARDAAVLVQTLDGLTARYRDELDDDAFAGLRGALASEAEAASSALADDRTAVDEVQGTLEAARRRVGGWPLPDDGGLAMLEPGFERIYRRGRRALKAARKDPDTETFHELRKRAKDLWHAAQILRPAAPKAMKELARRAHALSDAGRRRPRPRRAARRRPRAPRDARAGRARAARAAHRAPPPAPAAQGAGAGAAPLRAQARRARQARPLAARRPSRTRRRRPRSSARSSCDAARGRLRPLRPVSNLGGQA